MGLNEEASGVPMTMLVGPTGNVGGAYPYPVYAGGGNQGGNNGMGDNNGWWIVLLIIILAAGNGFGNNNNGGGGAFGGGQPIIVNDGGSNGGAVQRGFDQAAIMSGITGVQSGVQNLSTQLCNCCGDISTQLCNGFNGVNMTVNGAQNALAQQMYTNQIADLERSFANQTAVTQGMTGIQSQLAQCCCDNRLATESLRATVLQENCTDRYEAANNTRDIIDNANRNNQAILDKLCQLELDAKNDKISDLERQLTMANLQASQTAQNAFIQQGFSDEVDALYNRLSNCPVPTTPVYGRTPIFTCNNNNGCGCNSGCGCGGNF